MLRLQSQLTAAFAQVIKLFALKQPAQLRQRLEQLQARARRGMGRASLALMPHCLRSATRSWGRSQRLRLRSRPLRSWRRCRSWVTRCGPPLPGSRGVCLLTRARAAQLAPDEIDFMTKHMTEGIASFQAVTEDGKM